MPTGPADKGPRDEVPHGESMRVAILRESVALVALLAVFDPDLLV
jgi:hypothetical protein